MVAIIDYGVGNLFSLQSALCSLGIASTLTSCPSELQAAQHIILPGVGAFQDAAQKLHHSGMVPALRTAASEGKPLLGICLGMQLLFEESMEYGTHKGLGFLPGTVVPLESALKNSALKVPHMGWNALEIRQKDAVFKYIKNKDHVYFVHSFYAKCSQANLLATSEYSFDVTAVVKQQNIYGMQFHPEKSGKTGLLLLKAFCEM